MTCASCKVFATAAIGEKKCEFKVCVGAMIVVHCSQLQAALLIQTSLWLAVCLGGFLNKISLDNCVS